MTATGGNIVNKLQSLGYSVIVNEEKIKYFYQSGDTPQKEEALPLLEELRKHKAEVMEFLRGQHTTPCLQVEKIEAMPLNEFAKTNLAMKVNSSVLGEIVCFASNDAVAEKLRAEGVIEAIYTASELEYLAKKGLTSEELRKLHEVKKVFWGSKIVN